MHNDNITDATEFHLCDVAHFEVALLVVAVAQRAIGHGERFKKTPHCPLKEETGLYIHHMSKTRTQKSDARQRIVETAERLFYAEGVRAVGIDRIVAEAEAAKMSLYNHFPSKDDLILAVLQYREEKFNGMLVSSMQIHSHALFVRLDRRELRLQPNLSFRRRRWLCMQRNCRMAPPMIQTVWRRR